MARKYDRIIRLFGSWIADLSDPDKALTYKERWQVIEAVARCQEIESTEPLDGLSLEIRRALSMATFREQLERIIERNRGARERGRKGADARYSERQDCSHEPEPDCPVTLRDLAREYAELKLKADEHNPNGMKDTLTGLGVDEPTICLLIKASNYGKIGHPIWSAISKIVNGYKVKNVGAYLLACIGRGQSEVHEIAKRFKA